MSNVIPIAKINNVLKLINVQLVNAKLISELIPLQVYAELAQPTVFLAKQMELDNVIHAKIIFI